MLIFCLPKQVNEANSDPYDVSEYRIASGELLDGLAFNSVTGAISGTPVIAGSSELEINSAANLDWLPVHVTLSVAQIAVMYTESALRFTVGEDIAQIVPVLTPATGADSFEVFPLLCSGKIGVYVTINHSISIRVS